MTLKIGLTKTGPDSLHQWFQREETVVSNMVVIGLYWVDNGMVLIQISDIKNTF